jgi:hypothetical protein
LNQNAAGTVRRHSFEGIISASAEILPYMGGFRKEVVRSGFPQTNKTMDLPAAIRCRK